MFLDHSSQPCKNLFCNLEHFFAFFFVFFFSFPFLPAPPPLPAKRPSSPPKTCARLLSNGAKRCCLANSDIFCKMGLGFRGAREGGRGGGVWCRSTNGVGGLSQFWCFPGERIHSDIYVQVTARPRRRFSYDSFA